MSIVVTGATGHLGHQVVLDLLDRGVSAAEIVATGRDLDKVQDLAERGVAVRALDFSDPVSLEGAFSAGDRVLLVSTNEMGQRVAQHQAVIDAAASAGVAQLVYTSAPKATTTPLRLAAEHKATEEAIAASGIPATILRNGWYIENYTGQLPTFVEHGAILGSAGDGRFSVAARADYAEAAAAVLSAPVSAHVGQVYELGGDQSLTLADIASAFTASTGQTIVYADVSAAEHLAALVGAGLPEPVAEIFVDVDQSAANGALEVAGGDLSTLIGHPTTTLAEALAP